MSESTCCHGSRTCSHACEWGRGWDAAMEQVRQAGLIRENSARTGGLSGVRSKAPDAATPMIPSPYFIATMPGTKK